jgi:hypothetical protein
LGIFGGNWDVNIYLAALPPAERLGCFYFGLNYCISTHICISSYDVEVVADHITAPDMLFGFLAAKRTFQGRDLYNYEPAKFSDSIRQEVIKSAVQKCFPYEIAARIIEQGLHGSILCSEELAGISISVLRALHLTSDPRVAMVIPDLISRIRKVKDLMYHRNYRPEENLAADEEATTAVNKLMTHLASMRIFGGQNSQALICAQNREAHSPAVGWLEMYEN